MPKKNQLSMLDRWALDEEMFPGNPLGLEKLEGLWVSYYDNGQKKEEGVYKNGREVGKWTFYNGDGSVKEVKEY